MKPKIKFFYFLFFIIFAILISGCEDKEFNSNWLDREITVDGSDVDWKNSMTFFEYSDAAIGIMNDNDYLYISFCPWDTRIQNQIMRKGLIVWFDPNKNHEKTFGICYPLELEEQNIPVVGIGNRQEAEKSLEKFKELQNSIGIIIPGEDKPIKMDLAEARSAGISAMVGNSSGRLFYEIKVPIKNINDNKYAIDLNNNNKLNIGFETPEVVMDPAPEITTEEITRAASGAGIVRRTQNSEEDLEDDSERLQPRNPLLENFQLWTIVTLSTEPS